MAEGYAYLNVAIGCDGWMQFNGMKANGKNYIAQETERLVKIAKDAWASE